MFKNELKKTADETLDTKLEDGTRGRHTPWSTPENKSAVQMKTKSLRK